MADEEIDDEEVFRRLGELRNEYVFVNPDLGGEIFEAMEKHLIFETNNFAFEYWTQKRGLNPFIGKNNRVIVKYWEDWHAFQQGGIYCVETNGVYFPDEKNRGVLASGVLQTHGTMYGQPLHHAFVRQATSEIKRDNPFFNFDVNKVISALETCFPQVQGNLEKVLGVKWDIGASFKPVLLDIGKVL